MADFADSDFWIAIATISPVIFLGNTVVMTQTFRARKGPASEWGVLISSFASVVGLGQIVLTLLVLEHKDSTAFPGGMTCAIWVLAATIFMTFLGAYAAGETRE